jgi:hypothetical protein
VKEIREVSVNGQFNLDKSRPPDVVPTMSHHIDGLLPMKGMVCQYIVFFCCRNVDIDEETASDLLS